MNDRYACPVCGRDDLWLTKNNMLRSHTADGKRRTDDNPPCSGTGGAPAKAVTGPVVAVSGGPDPDRATVPAGVPAAPQTAAQTCPGCGHDQHTGFCRELTMPGAPGDVDECGCLDSRTETEKLPLVPVADDCPFGDQGRHTFAFGECVCSFEDPNYVEPAPVLAASVSVPPPAGADMIMGTAHSESDAMDVLMADDVPSDGSHKLYRNKRYWLPDPITGLFKSWTRVTTMSETVSDLYSLNLWRIRMVLIGLARFPELLDELREIDQFDPETGKGNLSPKDHKDILNRIGSKSRALAGSKVPANWGTQMHTWIERLSRDEITLADVADKYRDEVTAWAAAMSEADLSAVPHLIERRITVPMYDTAGTFDQIVRVHRGRTIRLGNRIIRLNAGDHLIGDVKSGRDLDYGWGEISIQMSMYAHGAREGRVAVWDPEADSGDPDDLGLWRWEEIGIPAKSIRTDVGVIMHVPIGSGTCTMHWVDLEEGWKAVQLCESVRDWRKAKGLHMPFSIAEITTSMPPVVREPTWPERFEAVTTQDQGRAVYRSWLADGGDHKSSEAARYRKIMKDRISQLTESNA